jgi:hypothetical protein
MEAQPGPQPEQRNDLAQALRIARALEDPEGEDDDRQPREGDNQT